MKKKGSTKVAIRGLMFLALLFCGATTIIAAPGDLDPTFGSGGKLIAGPGYASDAAVQTDSKIVVLVGSFGGTSWLTRYNQDGSPDLTFGSGTGRTTVFGDVVYGVVIQPDGKIVAAGGSGNSFFIARFNSDGSFDTGFGGGTGKVLTALPCFSSSENFGADVAIQPDGKLVGAVRSEYSCPGYLIRYEIDGSLDVSFGNHGLVTVPTIGGFFDQVLVQSNGKIIVDTVCPGNNQCGVSRYEANGSPDLSFGSGGFASIPLPLTIQPDGKIITGGANFSLARYNINGSLDTSFGLNGLVTTPIGAGNAYINSAAIQPDGKILAAGSSIGSNGTSDFTLVKYNGDGSLDATFGGGDGITTVDFNNSWDSASKVVLDSQGRAVVVGGSGGMHDLFAIARFLGDPPTSTCPNPIDCADFFVSQHYRDFLNREPDPDGLAFWTNEITSCGSDVQCIEVKRINDSAAFFLSIEFQETGYFVHRLYKTAYGDIPNSPVPLTFSEFIPDMQTMGHDLIVLRPGWEQVLESNKQSFAVDFVQRPRFTAAFTPAMSPEEFVDKLNLNAGNPLLQTERDQLVSDLLAGRRSRADVLRVIAENPHLLRDEFNRAFVLMQYFGYLRRNPNDAPDGNFDGYNFWLNKLNQFNGNYVEAEMVKAFLSSSEYRSRFGP